MEFLKYEEDHKMYLDKKNKMIKKEDCQYEEYDADGHLVKHFNFSDQLRGIFLKKTYDASGKMNCVIKSTYKNGKLNGLYELKRYASEILSYIERAVYEDDKLNGFREIKQYDGKDIVLSSLSEYTNGLRNGHFKEVTSDLTIEGTYTLDKYDGLINVQYEMNSKKELLLYNNGILKKVIDATYVVESITKSLIFSDNVETVWRTGWYDINVPVIVKCAVNGSTIKTPYIINSTLHRINRCKIIEIYDADNENMTYSQYHSDMANDFGVVLSINEIISSTEIDMSPININSDGIYVYLYKDIAENAIL